MRQRPFLPGAIAWQVECRSSIVGLLKEAEVVEDEEDGQDEIRNHAEEHDKVKGGCISFLLFGRVHNVIPSGRLNWDPF